MRQLLAETGRDGSGQALPLGRLDADAVSQLVAAAANTSDLLVSADLVDRLYRETEGLPFLLTAYLQTLPQIASEAEAWRLPPTARDLFLSHLAQAADSGRTAQPA